MKNHLRGDFSRKALSLRHKFKKTHDGEAPEAPEAAEPVNDNLPRWNLNDLYPGLASAEIEADKREIDLRAAKFKEDYEGYVGYLSGAELGEAIAEYEAIENMRQKITCYVTLMEADDLNNFAKTENLKKWDSAAGGQIGFFEAEVAAMAERDLMTKLGAPELAHYAPWVARIRASNSDLLDDDVESMSGEFQSVNREAWRRLYYETLNAIRVEVDGKKYSIDEVHEAMAGAPLEERQIMRDKIGDALESHGKRMALIYNTMIKDTLIDMELRKFARPDEGENTGNALSPEIVDTMTETVKASYSKLSHRFYAWKAKQHGVEVMKRPQLSMELPDASKKEDSGVYDFDEARRIILRAFKRFSPKFSRIAKKFFDTNHIDAQPRPEKETGAFSMPTGPDNFPYVFMTYTGGIDDLVTLGHELGHAVHQVLAEKKRGLFLSEMSTAISETASIFAESLVFDEILSKEKDTAVKKDLLVEKVEGMLLNSLQQLSYYDFEMKVHEARKKGELSVEEISDIWLQTQKDFFGPSVETDKYDRYYWMVVPHFFDSPFYVYSYSFAQNLVSGLYQAYKTAEAEGPEARDEFVENYIELLETGITRNVYEMTSPFDLDPETPEFWEKGLSLIDKYLTVLEKMDEEPKAVPKAKKDSVPKGPAAA